MIRGCVEGQDLLSSAAPVEEEAKAVDVSKLNPTVAVPAHSAVSLVDFSASSRDVKLKAPRMSPVLKAVSALATVLEMTCHPYCTGPPTATAATASPPPSVEGSAYNPHSSMSFASLVVCCSRWLRVMMIVVVGKIVVALGRMLLLD